MRFKFSVYVKLLNPAFSNLCLKAIPASKYVCYKDSVCGRSLAGITGSNPTRGMDVCLLWRVSGTGPCDGPIPRPEESYRLCVVCVI
jgi:hypothetical protein